MRNMPQWKDKPFALICEDSNRLFLQAISPSAQSLGLVPGMALTDARAAYPELLTTPASPHNDARLLQTILRWATRYTPIVSRAGHDEILLDVTGCVHLFKSQANLLSDIVRRLQTAGFSVRPGAAPTPGAAWALSHFGKHNDRDFSSIIVDPGGKEQGASQDLRQAMAPLPVEALRLGPATCACSRQLGLKTIGSLFSVPEKSLALRLGLEALKRLRQMIGESPEPIRPARYRRAYQEQQNFSDPLIRTQDIVFVLDRLANRLCQRLENDNQGLRAATLCLERVDHTTHILGIRTSAPSCDKHALLRLFAKPLDGLDIGFGIERMRLSADRVASIKMRQSAWSRGSETDQNMDTCTQVIDSLSNRFGDAQVLAFAPTATHIPEYAIATQAAINMPPPGTVERSWVRQAFSPPLPMHPLQLLQAPQSVAETPAIHGICPPPEIIRWNNKPVAICVLAGPERIEPQWWTDNPHWGDDTRDYWWVQTVDGTLLWLFATPHGPGRNRTLWCVHGLGS